MADVKALEHPTLKVPYEILNKKFRSAQKSIDRESSRTTEAVDEIETCFQSPDAVTVGQMKRALDGVVEKLTFLKRKAVEGIQEETDAAKVCKKRIEHLKEYEAAHPAVEAQWKKKRLDRMLVEYFLRCGYYKTALRLAEHSNIKDLTNINLFMLSKEVEESLERCETAPCLMWCHDNRSKLRKMKSSLEFNLRQQEFIELVKCNERLEAIRHARKYFTNLDETQLFEVQRVMGLLAFPSDTQLEPYKSLLDVDRWSSLVHQFRYENFKLHQLSNTSVFGVSLQAGLSALKTPHCYKPDQSGRNTDCPVCSKHLNELARHLPYAHCAQSKLICNISGVPLNEHNPPMMLPNGNVYGSMALEEHAAKNEGVIVCPRTKEIYKLDEAEKVFVM